MKKFRWFWLTLLIVQPIFVYLTRTGLRLPVPVHFGLFGSDAWNGLAGQDLVIAMSISGLLPLLGLILTYWSQNPISTTLPRWQPTPRSALSCWTVIANWLVLANLFMTAPLFTIIWLLLDLGLLLVLLSFVGQLYWRQNHP
ncbi:hypothetical protein RA086_07060 [Lactiplantibacillus sp. WILCCON 0030]|uniref:Integral membrane protein n=1 Tax=Lactiplantibacillus brownii TaxID=3069269 RepID=A0ABU1AAM5_9LACO|nr:hypothetical protein [Lactiplantibacillus brownii]MDQ7937385.1 hypothetical protein [Lactiplantibacillus brownii]